MYLKAGIIAGLATLLTGTAWADDEGTAAPAAETPPSAPGANATDEPSLADKAPDLPEKTPDKARWADSEVSLTTNVGGTTIVPVEQSYNPYVGETVSLDPRWKWNERLTLSAHLAIETELTNSDITTYKRQPLLDDLFVSGSMPLKKLPWGLKGSIGLRLTLPTSLSSQARGTIFALAPAISFNKSFELSKNVTLQPFASVRTNFFVSRYEEVQFAAPSISCIGDNCDQLNHGASKNSFMTFTETLGLNAELPKNFSATASIGWIQQFLYPNQAIPSQMLPGGSVQTRFLNVYVLEGAWSYHENLKFAGGIQTFNDQLALDGKYQYPFINRYSQVYLRGTYVF